MLVIGPGKSNILKDVHLQSYFKIIDLVDHNQEALDYQKNILINCNSKVSYFNDELSTKGFTNFLQEKYDIILCTEVLEHVHNNNELLKEMNNRLTSDGFLFVSVPNKYIDKFLMKFDKTYMHTNDNSKGHVNFYNKKTFKNLLQNSNFKIFSLKGIASEFLPFHLMLTISKIKVDDDTGEIIEQNSLYVKFGGFLMKLLVLSRLNKLLNHFLPRCYLAIVKNN